MKSVSSADVASFWLSTSTLSCNFPVCVGLRRIEVELLNPSFVWNDDTNHRRLLFVGH